ncbi:PPAP2A.2 family protein [Megaselia abdita]
MSSESTVSETTPLSRPDSSYLNDSTTSSTNEHYKHTNNNNNNNNEVRTSAVRPSTQNNNYIVTNIEDTNNKMDPKHTSATNGRIIRRIIYDIIVLAAVGFPILCMFLWGQPYKRGFFCDDESIKHPFHESTVKSWMLWIIGFILPVIMVVSTEIFLANRNRSIPSVSVTCVERKVPSWAIEVYKVIGVYMFGAAVQQLITDIAKYTVGRLRPHFYSVCQPQMVDGTDCSDPKNLGRYIEDFTCKGVGSSAKMLKEMRLSFPSGHSGFTFYAMVFLALYLQSRMKWRGSKLLKHFLQFMLVIIAWFTALSRISDYKHHWSDVLAGSLIGIVFAFLVVSFLK